MSGIGKVVGVMHLPVVANEEGAVAGGGGQDATVGQLQNVTDAGLQSVGEGEVDERLRGRVETVKTMGRTNPQATVTVGKEAERAVVAERCRVGIVMEEGLETVAIETIQTIVGGNPDAAVLILAEAVDESAGEA